MSDESAPTFLQRIGLVKKPQPPPMDFESARNLSLGGGLVLNQQLLDALRTAHPEVEGGGVAAAQSAALSPASMNAANVEQAQADATDPMKYAEELEKQRNKVRTKFAPAASDQSAALKE